MKIFLKLFAIAAAFGMAPAAALAAPAPVAPASAAPAPASATPAPADNSAAASDHGANSAAAAPAVAAPAPAAPTAGIGQPADDYGLQPSVTPIGERGGQPRGPHRIHQHPRALQVARAVQAR